MFCCVPFNRAFSPAPSFKHYKLIVKIMDARGVEQQVVFGRVRICGGRYCASSVRVCLICWLLRVIAAAISPEFHLTFHTCRVAVGYAPDAMACPQAVSRRAS